MLGPKPLDCLNESNSFAALVYFFIYLRVLHQMIRLGSSNDRKEEKKERWEKRNKLRLDIRKELCKIDKKEKCNQ